MIGLVKVRPNWIPLLVDFIRLNVDALWCNKSHVIRKRACMITHEEVKLASYVIRSGTNYLSRIAFIIESFLPHNMAFITN